MAHRSTARAPLPGRGDHAPCRASRHPAPRPSCLREMDERVATAIRREGVSRGTALALYGDAVTAHPDDPCAARDRLEALLAELVAA
jgi:hypothetical protein